MSSINQKKCSSCGERFRCGAEANEHPCWCEDLPHVPLTPIDGRDCFCPTCLSGVIQAALQSNGPSEQPAPESQRASQHVLAVAEIAVDPAALLVEGEDYYSEAGMIVFTASYHRRRGYCCESGCRHCPYKD